MTHTFTCGSNVGECTVGTMICALDTGVCSPCSGVGPAPEICDGKDNNCDGQTDEGCFDATPFSVPCGSAVGECRPGTMECDPVTRNCSACLGAVGPTTEVCDGLDNDCNGKTDDNCVGSLCTPASIDIASAVAQTNTGFDCSGTSTQCSPLSSGSQCGGGGASMTFCVNTCENPNFFPFAQCKLSNADLHSFDADNGNSGTLEVHLCLNQAMHGGMSLQYGDYPRRKSIPLFDAAERNAGVGPGCYTKYLRPSSARCGQISSSAGVTELPSVCIKGNWVCPDGKWTSADPNCRFDYQNVPLWLAFEDCVPGFGAANMVENLTVRYFPETCDCTPGASCGTGLVCKTTPYFDLRPDPTRPPQPPVYIDSSNTTNICRSDN